MSGSSGSSGSSLRHPDRPRRTVLLTGASGVVGRALLDRLTRTAETDVVALVHRTPVAHPGVVSIRGDIAQPCFGLSAEEYAELAERVDAVVHCAAVTDFNRTDGSLETTNIDGTVEVSSFVRRAGAVLYHVSTAFVHTAIDGPRGRTAIGYASSKSAAEDCVRAAGIPHVILRPSVVIGDSRTGAISAFQGLHQVVASVFAGAVPMIPFDPSWPIDFVPTDVVADAIAGVVEHAVTAGEFWITAGEQALTLEEAMALAVEMAGQYGRDVTTPRFVPPDLYDRLIGPVFIDALPAKIKRNVLRMLEFFTTYLQAGATKPDSWAELARYGIAPLPDQRASLRASIDFWAQERGYTRAEFAPGYADVPQAA